MGQARDVMDQMTTLAIEDRDRNRPVIHHRTGRCSAWKLRVISRAPALKVR